MNYSKFMKIFNTSNDLLEERTCLWFFELFLFDDVLKQFPLADVLHHQEQLLGGFDDLIQLDDVRMPNLLEDADLSGDSFDIRNISYFTFFKNFNCNFFLSLRMDSHLHLPECTLS